MAAPYVPTSGYDVDRVLDRAKLKKGMQFVDLGSGDGRLVLRAVQKFGVNGVGVEFNPLLVWFAQIRAKTLGIKNAVFICGKLENFRLDNAHVVYLFLLPREMKKMSDKIKKECTPGTLIISRGFEAPDLKQVDYLDTKTFHTFYYRV